MSGAGPFTVFGYFASISHTTPKRVENPPARGRTVWGACFASNRFWRESGKGIVSITAGNAALTRRCLGRSRPKAARRSLRRKSVNARAAGFLGFF